MSDEWGDTMWGYRLRLTKSTKIQDIVGENLLGCLISIVEISLTSWISISTCSIKLQKEKKKSGILCPWWEQSNYSHYFME